MNVIYLCGDDIHLEKNTVVTIGNFDGLHKGHMLLIDKVKENAKKMQCLSAVLSFYPHPVSFLTGGENIKLIVTREEKSFLLNELEVDVYIEYPFTQEFAELEPFDFVRIILNEKLKCKKVIVGSSYRFGKNRQGDKEMLSGLCNQFGIELEIVDDLSLGDEKVSSTTIRKLIEDGDFPSASHFLERPYFVTGEVVKGKQLGRTIGFPTVNVIPYKNKLLPCDGVYVTKTKILGGDGRSFNSITNVGKNPTVQGKQRTVETYIFDFDGDLYEKYVTIDFLKQLRREMTFSSVDELMNQIKIDVSGARTFFQSMTKE